MKTKTSLLLMITFLFMVGLTVIIPTDVYATDSVIPEIKKLLNEEGKLVVTDTTMLEDKEYFLWEYLLKYATNTYTYNTSTVDAQNSIYKIIVPNKGEHAVEVVFAEDVYSDTFSSVLKDGKLQVPASNNNNLTNRISDYLYACSKEIKTNSFNISNPMTYEPFITEDNTKVVLRMTDEVGRIVEQHIVELSYITEQSNEFKSVLDNGKFVFNAAKPESMDDFYTLWDLLVSSAGNEKDYGISCVADDLSSFDLSINYSNKNIETHTVQTYFNYDKEVKEKLQGFINNFPKDKTFFWVKDLELVNYWVNNVENDDSEHLDLFSGELKAAINNNNINYYVDNRSGMYSPFKTERMGMAMFTMNDIIYYTDETLGTKADYIIYVPDETGNTKEALIAAAQKRINEYLGEKSKVTATVSYAGTVLDIWVARMYEYSRYEWSEWDPNLSIEDWKMGNLPAYEDFGRDVIKMDDVTENDPVYMLTVKVGEKEGKFDFLIKKDSSRMITPSYKTVDMKTEVEVSSADTSIPLDTAVTVEKVQNNTIKEALGTDVYAAYDITLYSGAKEAKVEKLEDGMFKVCVPVPENLKDIENLTVYYIDDNGNKKDYNGQIDDETGFASFETNHFSTYVVAQKVEETYKVLFDANGGKYSNGNSTLTFAAWNNDEYNYDSIIKPTREGYKFLGFYTAKTGGTTLQLLMAEAGIDEDMTFYARWEKINEDKLDETPKTGANYTINYVIALTALAGISIVSLKRKLSK